MIQLLWCCVYLALFVFIIHKSAFFRLPGVTSTRTLFFFLLKIISATVAWNIFIQYYPATDSSNFFNDTEILYRAFYKDTTTFFKIFFGFDNTPHAQELLAKTMTWNNTSSSFLIVDSRTMIRLYVILRFFSFGYFYVQAIIMCFFAFTGLVYLYKLFFPYFKNAPDVLIIAWFLFPSVVFWSSTILKEGVLFLAMGMMLYHCQCGLRNNYRIKNVVGFLLGFMFLVCIKLYVVLAMLPALFANFWIAGSNHQRVIFKYSVAYALFILFLLTARFITPSLDFGNVLSRKQTDFENVAKGGVVLYHDSCFIYVHYDKQEECLLPVKKDTYKLKKGYQYASFKWGKTDTVFIDASDTNDFKMMYNLVPARSAFAIHKIKPDMMDVLKNAPRAFLNTMIIPPLFTMNKAFTGFILVENLLLLLCLISVFFVLKNEIPLAMVLFCGSFVLILFTLIGLITPVLGALVRYRIPGIPFLVVLIGLMADERKIKDLIFKLKKNLFKKG